MRLIVAVCATASALVACGGGGSDSPATASAAPMPVEQGAPALTNDIATDGRNWINYRRMQVGMPTLTRNAIIDVAALGHSEYQRTNNTVTHGQTPGKQGFTGATLLDRLTAAGYTFANANHAYGEVISATSSTNGAYLAEELITAIYHRFVIFEPVFKEIGTGAATTAAGYSYFTADFTANNGYGPGVPAGSVVVWPFSGQTQVTPNFFSDYESPDPVPNVNEVGYPISVHANINAVLTVQSFTVRPKGASADLNVRLLTRDVDPETPRSAAAIVPLARLASGTSYDVSFTGTVDGTPVSRTWTFTTK
ncbi:CAP domain-containing protein [Massilia solisilvae]|uniref:CAP domain-containing protein n=1 Tax=Massilia solisilvae TaxID=1811225 RepID=UPI0027D94EF7|nr:CAP domain-containing protein [Massilia solisilvae]